MQRVPDAPFRDRKGREYTWLDVRRVLVARLRKRYGASVNDDIIEDASSDAITDLLDYWQTLASSKKEDRLVLEFALRRGLHRAKEAIHRYVQLNRQEVLAGYTDLSAADADEDWEDENFSVIDDDPTTDEVVEDLDFTSRARRMLSELSDADLADWAATLLSGQGQRTQARRLGVNQSSISRANAARRETARLLAPKYGLV
jgi:hypothetical protein